MVNPRDIAGERGKKKQKTNPDPNSNSVMFVIVEGKSLRLMVVWNLTA